MSGRTVFFGPFIGEFGWELLFWQGWVRKVCQGEFKSDRTIAASMPGRAPFYPYVDEFWPLPASFLELPLSKHGYFTDGWRDGYPGIAFEGHTWRSIAGALRRLQRPVPQRRQRPLPAPDVEPLAEAMLAEFSRRLPPETLYFVPWKLNQYQPDQLVFGIETRPGKDAPVFLERHIPFEQQQFDYLQPTAEGLAAFRQIRTGAQPLVALFPRHRSLRRPEKNWSSGKYVALINAIQRRWPEWRVAIVGEPGGAYFADGVPEGCLDLINVPPALRMDIQLAALQESALALGGMSGALLVALAAGCPSLIWGLPDEQARYYRENFMGTPMIYFAEADPAVETVIELAQDFRRMMASGQRADAAASSAAL